MPPPQEPNTTARCALTFQAALAPTPLGSSGLARERSTFTPSPQRPWSQRRDTGQRLHLAQPFCGGVYHQPPLVPLTILTESCNRSNPLSVIGSTTAPRGICQSHPSLNTLLWRRTLRTSPSLVALSWLYPVAELHTPPILHLFMTRHSSEKAINSSPIGSNMPPRLTPLSTYRGWAYP